jgi:hypothetical protein
LDLTPERQIEGGLQFGDNFDGDDERVLVETTLPGDLLSSFRFASWTRNATLCGVPLHAKPNEERVAFSHGFRDPCSAIAHSPQLNGLAEIPVFRLFSRYRTKEVLHCVLGLGLHARLPLDRRRVRTWVRMICQRPTGPFVRSVDRTDWDRIAAASRRGSWECQCVVLGIVNASRRSIASIAPFAVRAVVSSGTTPQAFSPSARRSLSSNGLRGSSDKAREDDRDVAQSGIHCHKPDR